jgi:hypothetical protein
MNNKRILNGLIVTIFLILGAMFVSAAGGINIVSPTDDSYYGTGQNVTINATFTGGTNVSSYSVNVTDTTGVQTYFEEVTGLSEATVFTSLIVWNASDETVDGTYTINFDFVDNDTNATGSQEVIVDHTAPTSTFVITGTKNHQQDQTLTSGGEIDYGTEVTVNCGAADATAGLSTTRSSISIKYPGVATHTNVSSAILTSTNSTLSVGLLRSDTDILGGMSIICTLYDQAGNTFSEQYNLTTVTVIQQGTSAFAVEGFEAPVGKIKLSSGTISDIGRLTTEGESRLMKTGAAIKADMVGEEHKIEVKAASATEVTLIVTSEAQEVTITAGESESVDVNGDGIADLAITYHKLFAGSYADLTFALTSEAVEVAEEVEEVEETISETESEQYVEPKGGLTVTLAVIVIILIIGYALIKGKKK